MVMSAFYEESSTVLTPLAFEFVLQNEIRRAVRSQEFLTLIVVKAGRAREGVALVPDDGAVPEVAEVISKEIRDTDFIGHTDTSTLSLVLLNADFENSTRVIDRLVARIQSYNFSTVQRIAVGAACYPTHAVDVESLKRQAVSRPIADWRGTRASIDQN
jgi:GGDEF domain-containing protein